jgi:hypothetical protein
MHCSQTRKQACFEGIPMVTMLAIPGFESQFGTPIFGNREVHLAGYPLWVVITCRTPGPWRIETAKTGQLAPFVKNDVRLQMCYPRFPESVRPKICHQANDLSSYA